MNAYCDECGRPGASFVTAHPVIPSEVIFLCGVHAPIAAVRRRLRLRAKEAER